MKLLNNGFAVSLLVAAAIVNGSSIRPASSSLHGAPNDEASNLPAKLCSSVDFNNDCKTMEARKPMKKKKKKNKGP